MFTYIIFTPNSAQNNDCCTVQITIRWNATEHVLSRQGKDAHPFSWEVIEGLLDRELKRGQMCRVPGLKENFVYRDSWTRLNVKPAKIMQVCCKQSVYCIKACINLVYTHTHTHTRSWTRRICFTIPNPFQCCQCPRSGFVLKSMPADVWKRHSGLHQIYG